MNSSRSEALIKLNKDLKFLRLLFLPLLTILISNNLYAGFGKCSIYIKDANGLVYQNLNCGVMKSSTNGYRFVGSISKGTSHAPFYMVINQPRTNPNHTRIQMDIDEDTYHLSQGALNREYKFDLRKTSGGARAEFLIEFIRDIRGQNLTLKQGGRIYIEADIFPND